MWFKSHTEYVRLIEFQSWINAIEFQNWIDDVDRIGWNLRAEIIIKMTARFSPRTELLMFTKLIEIENRINNYDWDDFKTKTELLIPTELIEIQKLDDDDNVIDWNPRLIIIIELVEIQEQRNCNNACADLIQDQSLLFMRISEQPNGLRILVMPVPARACWLVISNRRKHVFLVPGKTCCWFFLPHEPVSGIRMLLNIPEIVPASFSTKPQHPDTSFVWEGK